MNRAYDISAAMMAGEEVSEDDKKYLKDYNASYGIVQFLINQKFDMEGKGYSDFHFTPGDNFLDTPIIDVVNSVLEMFDKTERGEIKPTTVEDLT